MNTTDPTFPAPTTGQISAFCRCGCGEPVASYRSIYRPGHDSKHISQLLIGILTGLEQHDRHDLTLPQFQELVDEAFIALPSPSLQDRLYNAVRNYGRGRLLARLVALGVQPFEAPRKVDHVHDTPAE